MADNKTEHRGDMGKVAKDREKNPRSRTEGFSASQSSEKPKVGG